MPSCAICAASDVPPTRSSARIRLTDQPCSTCPGLKYVARSAKPRSASRATRRTCHPTDCTRRLESAAAALLACAAPVRCHGGPAAGAPRTAIRSSVYRCRWAASRCGRGASRTLDRASGLHMPVAHSKLCRDPRDAVAGVAAGLQVPAQVPEAECPCAVPQEPIAATMDRKSALKDQPTRRLRWLWVCPCVAGSPSLPPFSFGSVRTLDTEPAQNSPVASVRSAAWPVSKILDSAAIPRPDVDHDAGTGFLRGAPAGPSTGRGQGPHHSTIWIRDDRPGEMRRARLTMGDGQTATPVDLGDLDPESESRCRSWCNPLSLGGAVMPQCRRGRQRAGPAPRTWASDWS